MYNVAKYEGLITDLRDDGYFQSLPCSMVTRSLNFKSTYNELKGTARNMVMRSASEAAEKSSSWLWLSCSEREVKLLQ